LGVSADVLVTVQGRLISTAGISATRSLTGSCSAILLKNSMSELS